MDVPDGSVVAEAGSPHGGSWLGLLAARGLAPADCGGQADVIVDCFGMMHAADQRAALAERAARIAPGGRLLLQYHSLEHDHRRWAVERRSGTGALRVLLDDRTDRHAGCGWIQPGVRPGGSSCTEARCCSPSRRGTATGVPVPDRTGKSCRCSPTTRSVGVRDPGAFAGLQRDMQDHAKSLHDWLAAERSAGKTVLGYGAASRAVALLCQAHVDRDLLPVVIDASPAKQGLRMPGTDVPVAGPVELATRRPDVVLLFVPDLLAEVSGGLS